MIFPTHLQEDNCAVLQALENGDLDQDAYANFQKMEREKEHFELSAYERKKKARDFGKMLKTFHRLNNKDKLKD